jgi:hypothetical protein
MPTLTIEDRTGTGRPTGSITLPNVPERITLRELIGLRVREEVARYNLRPGNQFDGLVQPDGSEASLQGYRIAKPRRIDWERQAAAATAAFERNAFFVLVNRKQVVDLDEELTLTATFDVGFVKLSPLVGG